MIETEEAGVAYPAVEPGAPARSVIGQGRALHAAIAAAQTAPQTRRQSARAKPTSRCAAMSFASR